MDKPIIDNQVLNLKSLSIFLLNILKKYIKIFVIIIIAYITYFFIKSPVYSSSISFYSNYSSTSKISTVGFLQSLSGGPDNEELGFSLNVL